jgi:lipopolysaccharide export system permease protein
MKKLIFRKFIIDVFTFFLISLFIMGLIVWTLQAINYFDFVSKDGHGLKVYFLYTFLNFPKIIHRIIPFMFFISLFYTIIKYETNNELTIFWTNGISKFEFMNTMLKFSLMLMFFQIIFGSFLSPFSQLKARNVLKNSNIDFFTNLITNGKFINAVQDLTIYIEKKEQGRFSNIFIDDSSKNISRMIYAKTGLLVNNGKSKKFLLFDGKVININNNKINTFKFDQIDFGLQSFGSNSIIKPKIQETSSNILIKCIFNKIDKKLQNCDIDSLKEIKQELSKRFFKPLYIPLIALISCLLFISGKYSENYNKIKIYLFLIILFTVVISESSLRYIGDNNILLMSIYSIPLILFIIVYFFSYLKLKHV